MTRVRRILEELAEAPLWYWLAAAAIVGGWGAGMVWIVQATTPVAETCACAMGPSAQAAPVPDLNAHSGELALYRSPDGNIWEVSR